MKSLFLFSIFLLPQFTFAQGEFHVALISDPDGYVFIRSGPGKESPVIDTLYENDFFYCYGDTGQSWVSVQGPAYGKTGYMHHSRIVYFFQLDSAKQHPLILSAFSEIVTATNASFNSKAKYNSEEQITLNKKRDEIYEGKYCPAYHAFVTLFITQPDSILLVAFFKTLQPLS
ncbi:MAG: SH3 domain-containing protein, partial [Bacteroidota bacterium]|nr:SH3 domain-containing protein [Bacteroidota bacterium]